MSKEVSSSLVWHLNPLQCVGIVTNQILYYVDLHDFGVVFLKSLEHYIFFILFYSTDFYL